jgi:hypothetical protein
VEIVDRQNSQVNGCSLRHGAPGWLSRKDQRHSGNGNRKRISHGFTVKG